MFKKAKATAFKQKGVKYVDDERGVFPGGSWSNAQTDFKQLQMKYGVSHFIVMKINSC